MTQELYYVVTPEIVEIDKGVRELTGNQEVSLYQILGDKPDLITRIDVEVEDSTESAIEEYIWEMAPELFNETGDIKKFSLNQF